MFGIIYRCSFTCFSQAFHSSSICQDNQDVWAGRRVLLCAELAGEQEKPGKKGFMF